MTAPERYRDTVRRCVQLGKRIPNPPNPGECGDCDAAVPPVGKVIGYFGAQDRFPVLCRECCEAMNIPGMVEAWDLEVSMESERRAQRAER